MSAKKLIDELRAEIPRWRGTNADALFARSADELAASQEEITRLRKALEPFAHIADIFDFKGGNRPTTGEIMSWSDHRVGDRCLTVEMLRTARALLPTHPHEGDSA